MKLNNEDYFEKHLQIYLNEIKQLQEDIQIKKDAIDDLNVKHFLFMKIKKEIPDLQICNKGYFHAKSIDQNWEEIAFDSQSQCSTTIHQAIPIRILFDHKIYGTPIKLFESEFREYYNDDELGHLFNYDLDSEWENKAELLGKNAKGDIALNIINDYIKRNASDWKD